MDVKFTNRNGFQISVVTGGTFHHFGNRPIKLTSLFFKGESRKALHTKNIQNSSSEGYCLIASRRTTTEESTKLPETHLGDATNFADCYTDRKMRSNQKLESALSSPNRTRSQPCSPVTSTERGKKLKDETDRSKSLPSSPTILKDIPKQGHTTNKTTKITTRSTVIDLHLDHLNDNDSQKAATTDITLQDTEPQSNEDGVLFLACKRTRSRKREGSFKHRIGSHSAPNSPMMVARIGASGKNRKKKSNSVPTSPGEQLQKELYKTRKLVSPDKKKATGHETFTSENPRQRENVDNLELFQSMSKPTDVTEQDAFQQAESEKEKLKSKRTTSMKRKRSHLRNTCATRSEPNSPLIATPTCSEIEVKEEEASKSLPSSPAEHLRHMIGVLGSAWNKLCRAFSK